MYVFIGVYWQRYGQLVPDLGVSGLEEEFDLSGGLPRLLYDLAVLLSDQSERHRCPGTKEPSAHSYDGYARTSN
jgi:hypothetical protein